MSWTIVKHYLIAIALCALVGTSAISLSSWRGARDASEQLRSTLANQKQLLAQIDANEHEHATQLNQALERIDDLKRQIQTPDQILRALPQYLPLPQPIIQSPSANRTPSLKENENRPQSSNQQASGITSDKSQSTDTHETENAAQNPRQGIPSQQNLPDQPAVQLPTQDLKPLFDYVQHCRACQAQLAQAQANLHDEQSRAAALNKERDAAIKAAKGGSLWTRIKHSAIWFGIGVIAGTAITYEHPK